MIRARLLVWVIAMAPACFHPSYDHPACGPAQQCPPGLHCNEQLVCDPDGLGKVVDAGATDDSALGAPGEDASVDAVVPPTGCYAHWFNGDLALTPPAQVLAASVFLESRDPWISSDGLRLYLSQGTTPNSSSHDIFLATRTTPSSAFGTPVRVVNLSAVSDDTRPALTADERLIVLASNRNGAEFDIFMATRPTALDAFPAPDDRHLLNINADSVDHFDPFLSGDGLRLYFSPVTQSGQRIQVASRPTLDADFEPPVAVRGLGSDTILDADPALSPDERVMVFTSNRANGIGGTDLWYATRPDTQHDFSPPILIPVVNGLDNEGDPMLTADGCLLLFSSNRGRPVYQLFFAAITP